MKPLFAVIVGLSISTSALSDPYRHYGGHHAGGYGNGGWIAPLVIGGIVGYAVAARPQPAPVVVQQPVIPVYPSTPPYGYHYEQVLDANCSCYRFVLVPN